MRSVEEHVAFLAKEKQIITDLRDKLEEYTKKERFTIMDMADIANITMAVNEHINIVRVANSLFNEAQQSLGSLPASNTKH